MQRQGPREVRQLWSRRHGWPLGIRKALLVRAMRMPAPLKLTGSWAAGQHPLCLPHSSSSAPAGRCSALSSLLPAAQLPSKTRGLGECAALCHRAALGECAELRHREPALSGPTARIPGRSSEQASSPPHLHAGTRLARREPLHLQGHPDASLSSWRDCSDREAPGGAPRAAGGGPFLRWGAAGGCSHSSTRMFEEHFVVTVERHSPDLEGTRAPGLASAQSPFLQGLLSRRLAARVLSPVLPLLNARCGQPRTAPRTPHAPLHTEEQRPRTRVLPSPTRPSPAVHWGDGGSCVACAVRAATPFLVTRNGSITQQSPCSWARAWRPPAGETRRHCKCPTLSISGEAGRLIGSSWSLVCFKPLLGAWRVGDTRPPPHVWGERSLWTCLKCPIVECRTVTTERTHWIPLCERVRPQESRASQNSLLSPYTNEDTRTRARRGLGLKALQPEAWLQAWYPN